MKKIQLTQNKIALVDDEDYEWLNRWKWQSQKYKNGTYRATRCKYFPHLKRGRSVYMSREILNAPKGLCVDHINHNPLDNRRCNLRLCTYSQNGGNQLPINKKMTSNFKGVYQQKIQKRWESRIEFHRKKIYLGTFADEIDAAKAYDLKAKELFGEFALTNF